jgi:hypothetical protein
MAAPRLIYRLHIQLLEVRPAIWRRIEIRANATFWALHVAIQNAMGWTDSHLHDFELPNADGGEPTWIGMPDIDDEEWREVRTDYDERLDRWLHDPGELFNYNYDYGDRWCHEIRIEAIEAAPPRIRYPRCLAGERACPPEDVGGVSGYETFLEAIADPSHEEHEMYATWIGRKFDPERFDPAKVRFENPMRRLYQAYSAD